ncbi:MAG TPA: hypothetical protein PK909_03760 [Sphaerochaeta sp.]|nr:hypothetical protein [Sphaerochaeta sp.]
MNRYLLFITRRERIVTPLWILSIFSSLLFFTVLYPTLIPTAEEALALARTMQNPAMVAMMGPIYGIDAISQAIVMSQETLLWYLIAIALMNIFLITRHTRTDEELGRVELLLAQPIASKTPAIAPIIFALIVNIIIAFFSACGLLIVNLEGTTLCGALAFGAAMGVVGFFFAALTLLLAQLFATTTGVVTAGLSFLGGSYILRAFGDLQESSLSLYSPFGLALKVQAFYTNDLWPIGIILLPAVALIGLALLFNHVRDHGGGIIPQRAGRAHAPKSLLSPLGFAWRLSRGVMIAWGSALFILGLSYGSVIGELDTFVQSNELMKAIILQGGPNTLEDGYVALIFAIMAMVAGIPVMLSALRIRGEELRGRSELIFAQPTNRIGVYLPFLLIAFIESILMTVLLALGLVLGSANILALGEMICYGFAYLPAIWLLGGIATFLVGVLPSLTSLIWLLFASSFIITYVKQITQVPSWLSALNPFELIPRVPIEPFKAKPLVALTIMVALLVGGGLYRYERRDLD